MSIIQHAVVVLPVLAMLMMASPTGRRVAPRMFISLFAPSGRRTWWWYTGRCKACGSTAFGRVRAQELAAGTRRVSCGHRAYLTVARTYRSGNDSAGDA